MKIGGKSWKVNQLDGLGLALCSLVSDLQQPQQLPWLDPPDLRGCWIFFGGFAPLEILWTVQLKASTGHNTTLNFDMFLTPRNLSHVVCKH